VANRLLETTSLKTNKSCKLLSTSTLPQVRVTPHCLENLKNFLIIPILTIFPVAPTEIVRNIKSAGNLKHIAATMGLSESEFITRLLTLEQAKKEEMY